MNKLRHSKSRTQNTLTKNAIAFPKGVSLIEMLLVISLMSVIFTVAITTLGFLMRVEMKGTARIQETLNFQKLSHHFREDASIARNAVIISGDNNKSAELIFEIEPDISIIYSKNDATNSIVRLKKQLKKTIAQDEFRISADLVNFQVQKTNQREIVSMLLQFLSEEPHENKTIAKTRNTLIVEALVSQKYSLLIRTKTNKSN